jgi:hypothetical protein
VPVCALIDDELIIAGPPKTTAPLPLGEIVRLLLVVTAVTALVKMVEAEPADKQLELDFNINEKLKDWLSKNYNQRTIDVKGIDLKKQKKGKVFK